MSKSRLMRALQCEKALYLTLHQPDLSAEVSAATQAIFDQGHEVGARARQEFLGGILIDVPYYELAAAEAKTREAIAAGATTLYEATFAHDGIWVRADILNRPTNSDSWELFEVKSGTSVKPENFDDIALQLFVLEKAGISISAAYLMHLNSAATAPGLENLFTRVELTKEARARLTAFPGLLNGWRKMLAAGAAPTIDIGEHCSSPYECPFMAHCWQHVPETSVFDFPGIDAWDYYKKGILLLTDPRIEKLEGRLASRLEAVRSGNRWVDPAPIRREISTWKWPLLFLDFETIGFAIPRYDGTHPYQQVPFQFSALLQENPGGPFTPFEYLHTDATDPRPQLTAALVDVLPRAHSIVAYSKGFEGARMKELASMYPSAANILRDACDRLVDPLPLFRNAVYDAAFAGRFSIKKVAPAILGQGASYASMEVADGAAAQRAYLEMLHPATAPERKETLRKAMVEYCLKDTEVMMGLVNWLLTV